MAENTELHIVETGTVLELRDESQREIGIRIVPWNVVADTRDGPEVFVRGAFEGVDPTKVVLRMDHQNPPAGRGISLEDKDDGAYMAFRVSKTQRGDEILALASDGVSTGASVGYSLGGSQVDHQTLNGRRTRVVRRSALREVSTTWLPTWDEAAVTYIRSIPEAPEGDTPMPETPVTETPEQPAPIVNIDLGPLTEAMTAQNATMAQSLETFGQRITDIEERSRRDIVIPGRTDDTTAPNRGQWVQAVLRMLSGERVPDMQMRELADLITTDNLGVVPPAYSKEIIGVIDPRRPFLQSTRKLPTPDSGMSLVMPKIVTRPTVATQANEKDELASTATSITTETFDAITKGGVGDISLQLLKRSSPSFLSLYLELLAEAYAIESEDEAVDILLAEGTVNNGGTLDPEDASFGDAWRNAAQVTRRGPDTIWLSSQAVGAFIDAKANGTNAPLYSDLRADFTAAGGIGGNISGLRPVWVPALDDEAVDVIVGPSSGFAWAEDGTFTLQVDVPAKAGRDVAIVGILWFAPLYPSAFTKYAMAGS